MEGDPVPVTPSGLWSSTLLQEGGEVREDYDQCFVSFQTADGTAECYVIPVAVVQRKLLVAVPFGAWHRSPTERFLPRTALTKATLVEVEAVVLPDHPGGEAESQMCRLWIGFLRGDLARMGRVGESEAEGCVDFGDEDGVRIAPYAAPLVEIANDHFAFVSANSGAGDAGEQVQPNEGLAPEARFARLEESLEQIRASLAGLAGGRVAAPLPEPDKRRVQGARNYPGLDAGVLATARDAGISEEQLQRLSGLLVKPNRMEEKPRSQRAGGRQRTALSETEEDADEDEVELVPADEEAGVKEPVERAILQLTKLVSKMSEKESKKRSGLEEILDRVDTGGSADGSGGGTSSGRTKAAAYKKIRAALEKQPEWIYKSVEGLMEEDFQQIRSAPGASSRVVSSRAWIEHRSKLLHYPSTIRTAWIISGVHDCLKEGRVSEARARCALALGAIDQSSLDSGSWSLSQELLLEPAPPYHTFIGRRSPDLHEQATTKIIDDRILELAMWKLKEKDSYLESRRRLGGASKKPGGEAPGGGDPAAPKRQPKPTGKAKAKAASRADEPVHHEQ